MKNIDDRWSFVKNPHSLLEMQQFWSENLTDCPNTKSKPEATAAQFAWSNIYQIGSDRGKNALELLGRSGRITYLILL